MNRRDLFRLAGKVGVVALAQQVPWSWLERAGLVGEYQAEAAALPQNYQLRAGTVLFSGNNGIAGTVSNTKGFGPGTTSGTDNTDPQYIKTPGNTKSIRVSVDATGGQTAHYLDWAINRNFATAGAPQTFGVWIGIPGGVNTASVNVRWLVSSNPFASYFSTSGVQVLYTTQLDQPWNFINFHSTEMSATGGEVWTNTMTRVRLQLIYNGGGPITFYVDDGVVGYDAKPQVAFRFDAGDESTYTEAFSLMEQHGLKGCAAIKTNNINFETRLTDAQITEMHDAGWDVMSQSHSHANLTAISASALAAEIDTAQSYINSHGWTRGRDHFVYPGGFYNTAVIAALRARGYRYGWTVYGIPQMTVPGLSPGPMELASIATSGRTLDQLKSDLALGIKRGGHIIFYLNKILVGATGPDTEKSIFQGLIHEVSRLVRANVVGHRTLTGLIEGLTQPRLRRIT